MRWGLGGLECEVDRGGGMNETTPFKEFYNSLILFSTDIELLCNL